NHGDYLIPSLTLRPELAPGQSGLAVHLYNIFFYTNSYSL
ncbi:hypothetical protein ACG0RH_26300, partial [Klebsiella pneumoniae]